MTAGKRHRPAWLPLLAALLIAGCASYYENQLTFHREFGQGNLAQANANLDSRKDEAEGRNRLLWFLQKGVVLQMLGEYEESNRWFEQAYLYAEDYQKDLASTALSMITNPAVIPYGGEDFEVVLIHYYMAMNYLRLGMFDEALVSCRRVNLTLQELNDRYETRKNRYKRDAFAYNLMGIVFEAAGELNNAFISYRNAYEAYAEDYLSAFGVAPPEQLKRDLLRTAYRNRFTDELRYYEREFGMTYEPEERAGGELVFFWMNGLGPVKAEWGVNFVVNTNRRGAVTFVNDEYGMSFPFELEGISRRERDSITDLRIVRAAFPKYVERTPLFVRADLAVNGAQRPLELAENINAIAFSTLEDRMFREFGTALLRLAVKQAAESLAREKDEGLGTLLSLVNAVTEKADTRNWQTLPYSISYVRVPVPAGESEAVFTGCAPGAGIEQELRFPVSVREGQTVFNLYHSIQTVPVPMDVVAH